MIVALDTRCLVVWATQTEEEKLNRSRLDHLVDRVAGANGKIIIPAPALAEYLVGIDESAAEWINTLDRKKSIFIAPFDRRAAFECSLLDKAAINKGNKKAGRDEPWQKIKVDRQIVAIARVHQVSLLVTNDVGLRATATVAGMTPMRIGELDLPQSALQVPLPLSPVTNPTAGSR